MHREDSAVLEPLRKPPPGVRGEAMLRIPTRGVVLVRSGRLVEGECRRVWAVKRGSETVMLRVRVGWVGEVVVFSGLFFLVVGFLLVGAVLVSLDDGGGGSTINSEACTPFFAREWAVRSAGMVLFSVAFACLERAFLRYEGGGRPMEGVSRPMVWVDAVA